MFILAKIENSFCNLKKKNQNFYFRHKNGHKVNSSNMKIDVWQVLYMSDVPAKLSDGFWNNMLTRYDDDTRRQTKLDRNRLSVPRTSNLFHHFSKHAKTDNILKWTTGCTSFKMIFPLSMDKLHTMLWIDDRLVITWKIICVMPHNTQATHKTICLHIWLGT